MCFLKENFINILHMLVFHHANFDWKANKQIEALIIMQIFLFPQKQIE